MSTPAPSKKALSRATITEIELMALETNRASLDLLLSRVAEAKLRLDGLEKDIILRLDAGAKVQGSLVAVVQSVKGQCRPAWKDLFLDHMGAAHGKSAQTVEAETRAKTVIPTNRVLVIAPKGA